MAEEKKPPKPTQATASNVAEWVGAYYGDDAIDYSKANKIKHIMHTAQFATVAYLVSTNSKSAHVDFFDADYTTVDSRYAKAAELIIKLLHTKYKDGKRALTQADFDVCGGAELFGDVKASNPDRYAKICNDYIKTGGLVDDAQNVLPEYEEDEGNAKCYGDIVDEMDAVKERHTFLLGVAGSQNGTLTREQIFNLYDATTDNSTKIWKELKDAKSGGDFKLKEQMEEALGLRYTLAKKTVKLGLVGVGAVSALGAMAGGLVFMPAFIALGSYALGKRWLPEWCNAVGAMWGSVEKRYTTKRGIDRAVNRMDWLMRYIETDGHPNEGRSLKQIMGDLRDMPPWARAVYKKQAKTLGFSSIELHDGKTHKGVLHKSREKAGRIAKYRKNGATEPIDAVGVLNGLLEDIVLGKKVEFEQFEKFIEAYNKLGPQLSYDADYEIKKATAKKVKECAIKLIFETPMETMTQHNDQVSKFFAEDSDIFKIIGGNVARAEVEMIKRYVDFAGKELTGLRGSKDDGSPMWRGKTLTQYINRSGLERIENVSDPEKGLANLSYDVSTNTFSAGSGTGVTFATFGTDPKLQAALASIMTLQISVKSEKTVVDHAGRSLQKIKEDISDIANRDDRKKCNDLLKAQMQAVFYNAGREDSRKSFEALKKGDFTGKEAFSDVFKKIKDMKYENIDDVTYIALNRNITRDTSISPPAMGRYLRGKLGKAAFDIFSDEADKKRNVFPTQISELTTYLQKLNNCPFLTEEQKMKLTENVNEYVVYAIDKYTRNVAQSFLDSEKGYKQEAVSNFLTGDYLSGGFKQLFETDKSPAATAVKDLFESMNRMNQAHTALKLDGKNMSAADARTMGMILIRDADEGFDTFKVRASDDSLVDFLGNKLDFSAAYPSFAEVKEIKDVTTGTVIKTLKESLKDAIQQTGSPYRLLEDRLTYIQGNNVGDDGDGYFDKFAALVALKNKTIAELRKSLNQIIEDRRGSLSQSDWLSDSNNVSFYKDAVGVWEELCIKIDQEIAQSKINKETSLATDPDKLKKFTSAYNELGGTKALSKEIARYRGTQITYSLAAEPGLG